MILKCIVLATAVKIISCISPTNELHSIKNQRKKHLNFNSANSSVDFIPSLLLSTDTDKTNTMYVNFPDVLYPTCILDKQPFYYNANTYDVGLGPFSEDVQSSYKGINTNNKKNKLIHSVKSVENGKLKELPRANPSTIKEQCHKNQECEKDLILLQDNATVTEEKITGTENNVSEIVQDDLLKYQSLTIPSRLENDTNVIEKHNKHNESVFLNICDIVSSVECENVTNNVSTLFEVDSLNQIYEMKNNTSLEKSIKDDNPKKLQVKVNIEVLNMMPEKQKELFKTLPLYNIDRSVLNEENKKYSLIDVEQKNNKHSIEEPSIFSEDKNKFIYEANNTDEFPSLLLESCKENNICYPVLQLFNNTILEGFSCNTTDNHDFIDTVGKYLEHSNNTSHLNKIETKDIEDCNVDEEECFLDLIVSLASLCQMNDTLIPYHSDESK